MPIAPSPTPASATPAPDDDTVAVPRQVLDDLVARVARLEAAAPAAPGPGAPASAGPDGRTAAPGPALPGSAAGGVSRRRALVGLAGAAGAAAVAVTATAAPAAAANGDALVLGSQGNEATTPTGLAVSGSSRLYGLGATDNGLGSFGGSAAVLGHAKGQAFSQGVYGYAEQGTGVVGETGAGIGGQFFAAGANSIGLYVNGERTGIVANAEVNPLQVIPRAALPSNAAVAGTLYAHSPSGGEAELWFRNRSNTTDPRGWRKLAGSGTAGAFHLLPVPARIYDSRPGTTPAQGPKSPLPAGNISRTLDVTHNGTGVPAGATGVVVTLLLVNAPAGTGNLTLWTGNEARPPANTMVWGPGGGRFTTLAMTAVSPTNTVRVSSNLATDIVIDVVGYYR